MDLTGFKGFAAYQSYLRILFFLPLVQGGMDVKGKSQSELINELLDMPELNKKYVFLELLAIAPVDDEDALKLVKVHADKNGVAYSKTNIGNLSPNQVCDLVVQTLVACSELEDSNLFLDQKQLDEFKNYSINFESFAAENLQKNANLTIGELISLCLNDAYKQKLMADKANGQQ